MHQHHGDLAALLTDLKERSGLSYAWIGRKVNASKSAVHRYCAGQAVPHEFGTVERIARACGASPAELDRLYAVWTVAVRETPALVSGGEDTERPAATGEDSGPGAAGEDTAPGPAQENTVPPAADVPATPAPLSPPAPPSPPDLLDLQDLQDLPVKAGLRRLYALAAAAVAVLVAVVVTTVVIRSPAAPSKPDPSANPQWISGPTWTLPPAPVSPSFFGVTVNSSTGNTPGFTVGALRLWDSETRWAQIQPAKGVFDWSVLDRLVAGAEHAGLPVLYVAGGTPGWAAPGGRRSVYPEDARSAPPDDLADWDTYMRALTQRYRGRIEAYEVWVFANDARLYSGSVETLVEMTRRASTIIRAADPLARVVCPGMGNLWTAEAQRVLRRFAELGGYDHCDVAGIKLHQRTAEDPPETMLELTGLVDRTFHEAGVHPPLWNTGTTYAIPLQGSLDEVKARDYAVRFFLVGLLARNVNLERMYFYNWGGTKIPIVLQADGGQPTAAGLAVAQLKRWLTAAEIRSCGHGPAVNLPVNAWQCEFTVDTPLGRRRAVIRWVHTGTATMRTDPGAAELSRLDGTSKRLPAGGELVLTEEPVLINFDA
ncbi:hypothetical protein GCM10010399_29250 [Dactylosporangium fulvum]